jgi:hypothetical protein
MGHYIGSEVTAGVSPALHAGLNTKIASYSLAVTASGSQSFAMCAIPGGAVVTNVSVGHSTLDTSGGGSISVHGWIGGSLAATFISTASAAQVHTYNPAQLAVGYRFTSSGHLVVHTQGVADTGTGAVAITTVMQYTTDQDPD